jgi:tripartite-type tricarboxylate transporter receptor subunit TctC
MPLARRPAGLLAAVAAWLLVTCAAAADYPTQRVTLIVPFPAGGQTDVLARLLATQLSQRWGQAVVSDNRPGAGGIIGIDAAARARDDGHTLVMAANSIATYKLFVKDLAFDPLAAVRPVSQMVWSPLVMVIPAEVPVQTLGEFLAYARARPKKLNYATFSFSSYDLDMARFVKLAGVDMLPVPYNGAAPAYAALLRNDIQMMFGQPSMSVAYAAAGKVKVIATGSLERERQRPNVPTLRENGIDLQLGAWYGLFTASKVPDDTVARIAFDVDAALRSDAMRPKIDEMGFDIVSSTPQKFAEQLGREVKEYAETAQRLGIKPQ